MTYEELKQAAIDCLAKAFQNPTATVQSHVIEAATVIVLSKPHGEV